ncbi:MAG TPA: 30S ribosomal protein S16 [Armatimonadota bacterium]|nr:30S ribosomal protein S16 [Armatimonadota bacterium]
MAVKIRLMRLGAKKRPFYRIVVANSESKRDGRSIDQIGYYDPLTDPATVKLDADRALLWLQRGAQPTDTMADILRKQGVMERFEQEKAGRKQGAGAGS